MKKKLELNCSSKKGKVDLGERGVYSENNKLNNLTGKEWVKFTKSWAIINPTRRKEDTILHPAKFPEELIKQFILYFTKEGQVVFDPFLGTGSTLVASEELNRKGIGIELNKKYADISRNRVAKSLGKTQYIITGDSIKINSTLKKDIDIALKNFNADKIDFIITSPPYWDMLKKSRGNVISAKKIHFQNGGDDYYSNLKADIGNLENYEEYMSILINIFSQTYDLLRKGGYLVIIMQNIRVSEGNMVPVAWDLAMRLSNKYTLKQEKLWLQDNKKLNCWGYPSTYVSNVHHHYCLIFQK